MTPGLGRTRVAWPRTANERGHAAHSGGVAQAPPLSWRVPPGILHDPQEWEGSARHRAPPLSKAGPGGGGGARGSAGYVPSPRRSRVVAVGFGPFPGSGGPGVREGGGGGGGAGRALGGPPYTPPNCCPRRHFTQGQPARLWLVVRRAGRAVAAPDAQPLVQGAHRYLLRLPRCRKRRSVGNAHACGGGGGGHGGPWEFKATTGGGPA